MLHITRFLITLFLFTNIQSTQSQDTYTSHSGQEHLLGIIQIEQLEKEPFNDWYFSGYSLYKPDIDPRQYESLSGMDVTIFLGTWCGDTKRLLPKFIKLWDLAGLPREQLRLVSLHSEGKEYKRSPDRIERQYEIHRVPTFIFEKNGMEIGRIVERPVTGLTTDLRQMAAGIPASPRYQGVSYLSDVLKGTNTLLQADSLSDIASRISRITSGPGELNTFGYVLKAAGRLQDAERVFKINTLLYPYEPNVYDSLAEFYLENGDEECAKDYFKKVLLLKPNDRRVNSIIEKLE